MADIALVFHWPLSEMDGMSMDELHRWHTLASERFELKQKILKGLLYGK